MENANKVSTTALTLQIIYGVVSMTVLYAVVMWNIGMDIGLICRNDRQCNEHIKEGWFGFHVDLADGQWRDFRNSLWILSLAAMGLSFAQYLIRKVCFVTRIPHGETTQYIVLFRLISGFIVLAVQHGLHSLIVIVLAYIGYLIAESFKYSKYGVTAMWLYGFFILVFKESYRIMHEPGLGFLRPFFDRSYSGMYGWQLPANFLILRLISFSVDMFRAFDAKKQDAIPPIKTSFASPSSSGAENVSSSAHALKDSRSISSSSSSSMTDEHVQRKLDDYTLLNCMSYLTYAPLYIGGPVMTFNSYMRYTDQPQQKENVLMYAVRFVACLLLMEFLTNKFPFFAVVNSGLLPHLTISQIFVVCYMVLKLMWVKFLLIWRFMRLWAMMEGVLPPENMLRCMSNNFSIQQFWRGWHSSFNLWIVRYMYKPMGGSKSRMWSMFIIFTFVAIWHDIELKLLAWGFLNSGFMVVEMIAGKVTDSAAYNSLSFPVRRLLADMSGGIYIMILIGVNLVGYSIGVGGAGSVFEKLLSWDGLQATLVGYVLFSSGVNIMMLLRDYGYTSNL